MRHTLKAVFDQRSDAQHVLDELLASGYASADAALSSAPEGGEHAEGLGASVRHTLEKLFGPWQHKHAMADSDALMHGRHVVTLTADSEPAAERAVGIMKRFGPLGIEDLHDEESGTGTRGTAAGGPRPVYPPGTEPGALQNRSPEDSHYFGTQYAESPPTGNTYEETMGEDSQWRRPDEGPRRARAPSPLADADSGSRDNDMAAYRYGKEMHASDKYRNRSWDEAESSLKSGWEARATAAATWDGARAAVRSGWDGAAPDIDDAGNYRAH
jgi:hypothetical protein